MINAVVDSTYLDLKPVISLRYHTPLAHQQRA